MSATEITPAPARQSKPPIILPQSKDVWAPNYDERPDNVGVPVQTKPKTTEEKVEEVLEGGKECPWCGQSRESKEALKEHILAQHGGAVASDEEIERAALRFQFDQPPGDGARTGSKD